MRQSPQSNVVAFPSRSPSFDRRALLPAHRGLTCIPLVRHGTSRSGRAILVSCAGIRREAVWAPLAMLTIEQPSDRGILVATLSKAFAEQKRLAPRFIDPSLFNEATREVLADAVQRAAKKRMFYSGARVSSSRHVNQNAFS